MTVDSITERLHRLHRRANGASMQTGDDIQRRSPLEQAIAERKDRRVRWDRRKIEEGLARGTIWTVRESLDDVKAIAKLTIDGGADFQNELRELRERWTEK